MIRAQEFLFIPFWSNLSEKKTTKTTKGLTNGTKKFMTGGADRLRMGLELCRTERACAYAYVLDAYAYAYSPVTSTYTYVWVPSIRSPMCWIRMRTRMSRFIRVCVCGYIHVCVCGEHMGVFFCSGILWCLANRKNSAKVAIIHRKISRFSQIWLLTTCESMKNLNHRFIFLATYRIQISI